MAPTRFRVQVSQYRQVPIFPWRSSIIDIDRDHIDEVILALLFLGLHNGMRTWKSFDWAAMERLHTRTQSARLNPSYSLTKAYVSPKLFAVRPEG